MENNETQDQHSLELARILGGLYAPIPPASIKKNPRGYDYIPVEVAIGILNSVVGDWDFSVEHQEFVRIGDGFEVAHQSPLNSDTSEDFRAFGFGECVVRGTLTLKVNGRWISRTNFGSSPLTPYNKNTNDYQGFTGSPIGECYKAAASDCLKKCATMFGVAITDLYPNAKLYPFVPLFFQEPTAPLAAPQPPPKTEARKPEKKAEIVSEGEEDDDGMITFI